MLPLVLSSDSHVFEPPDLWQSRIDAAFRERAPRIERIDGADQLVVEADQILSGIGLISNAGARFEAPETISAQGLMEDVHPGGYEHRILGEARAQVGISHGHMPRSARLRLGSFRMWAAIPCRTKTPFSRT